jgi:hypothetical protein
MTRSKLALVTLLAGLLSLASVGTVSADPPCTRTAQGNCAQMAADDAFVYRIEAASPAHIVSGNGMGQEHFEAMTADQVTAYSVGPDATASGNPYSEALTPTIGLPR